MSLMKIEKLRRQAKLHYAIEVIRRRRGELLLAGGVSRRAFPDAEMRRRLIASPGAWPILRRIGLILVACAACFLATPSMVGLAHAASPQQAGAVAGGSIRITLTVPPRPAKGSAARGCVLPIGGERLELRDRHGATIAGDRGAAAAAACGRTPFVPATRLKEEFTILVAPQ